MRDPTSTPTSAAQVTTPTCAETPAPLLAPTGTATPIPPTPTISRPICPPMGYPEMAQPASFTDYPEAIQAYLSAGGNLETLRAHLTAWEVLPSDGKQLVATDLNGDGVVEVILSLVDPQGHVIAPSGMLLVFECSGGAYARAYCEGGGDTEAFDPSTQILRIDDLTLDGLPDVAYVLRTCGAHTCYECLEVLGWDGVKLVNLMGGTLGLPYPDYTLEPGRIVGASGGIGSVGAEPQRGYSEIWTWNGTVFTQTNTVFEPPVYRYHALLDGDRALRSGDYVTATQAYGRVVHDDTLKPFTGAISQADRVDERAVLTAFARWRLVLTHLVADRPERARMAYDSLDPGHDDDTVRDLARMAQVFWEAHEQHGTVTMGCAAIITESGPHTGILDFFNGNYGYANPHWEPADLCPF